jgi:hypothetical protein
MKSHKILFVVVFLIGVSAASFSIASAVRTSPQESDRARKRDEWQRPRDVMDAFAAKEGSAFSICALTRDQQGALRCAQDVKMRKQ